MPVSIRHGRDADGAGAIAVVRRSISELCRRDHRDAAGALADWLGNKTEAAWRAWVARPDAVVLVAERAGDIVGVGMVDRRGEVLLNYVAPEARFTGISTALLRALEDAARGLGATRCFLTSTETAQRFYESRGYLAPQARPLEMEKPL